MKEEVMENVILVDKNDNEIGAEEKMKVHKEGKLHRAFSIFVFNKEGQLLLQKRAKEKYHSPGLWANTCCSHPRPGELLEEAAKRRLKEEMGFECGLKKIFSFIYKAEFENGLVEHELDHVLMGIFNGEPNPNREEVDGYTFISLDLLEQDVQKSPGQYTPWLKIIVKKYINRFKDQNPFLW